jgi:exopolysaccharide biosynthesis polyprenyl glycosylphosphotransferase
VANYLGDVDQLDDIFLKHVVDAVVIAIPVRTCYEAIHKASAASEKAGVDVIFNAFFPGQMERTLSASFGDVEDRHAAFPYLAKRFFDMAVAAFALILLSPLMIAVGLLINLTSEGGALFVQERYGYRRRKFKMYKFRTMVENAEGLLSELERKNEANGPIFKMRNDPRITPIGRFLRKTSIDELPQLWNVLNGTMSLVGPRPMSVRDVSLFSDAYLMRRFRARPGITGLWQVSGRSDVKFEKWMELDFHYIDRWSLGLDLSILLRTIPAVFKGSGAM